MGRPCGWVGVYSGLIDCSSPLVWVNDDNSLLVYQIKSCDPNNCLMPMVTKNITENTTKDSTNPTNENGTEYPMPNNILAPAFFKVAQNLFLIHLI